MKKLIIVLLLALFTMACGKEGEIRRRSTQHIKIDGVEYYFLEIVPADGADGVWLLLPKNSEVEVPLPRTTSWMIRCGKNCHRMVTAIVIPPRNAHI